MSKSRHIVLIHGNFVNNRGWSAWKERYEARGYTVHTPANPGHQGVPQSLRDRVHPDLANTGFVEVVENLERFIDELPEKPLVVGHSMGGVAAMKLVERDKAVAGVSIHGAPPKNVFPAPFQTLRAVFPAIGLLSFGKTWLGSPDWYNYAFFNTLSEDERAAAYEANAVPESYKINRSLLFNAFSRVDFSKPHAPLFFLGGTSDHIFPAKFTRRIAGQYRDESSRVDVKIYEGRSHFTVGEPGWERVADDILGWYESLWTPARSKHCRWPSESC